MCRRICASLLFLIEGEIYDLEVGGSFGNRTRRAALRNATSPRSSSPREMQTASVSGCALMFNEVKYFAGEAESHGKLESLPSCA